MPQRFFLSKLGNENADIVFIEMSGNTLSLELTNLIFPKTLTKEGPKSRWAKTAPRGCAPRNVSQLWSLCMAFTETIVVKMYGKGVN